MKEKNLSKWFDSLPNINQAYKKIQDDSIKFLKNEFLKIKTLEEWRHTNLDRFEKIFHLPTSQKDEEIKVYFNSRNKKY